MSGWGGVSGRLRYRRVRMENSNSNIIAALSTGVVSQRRILLVRA